MIIFLVILILIDLTVSQANESIKFVLSIIPTTKCVVDDSKVVKSVFDQYRCEQNCLIRSRKCIEYLYDKTKNRCIVCLMYEITMKDVNVLGYQKYVPTNFDYFVYSEHPRITNCNLNDPINIHYYFKEIECAHKCLESHPNCTQYMFDSENEICYTCLLDSLEEFHLKSIRVYVDSKKKKFQKMNICLICVLIINFLYSPVFGKSCETEACTKLAAEINKMMDKTIDPCDDFSSFVCGNMDKIYSILPGTTYFDTDSQIEILIKQEIKNLLETQPLSNTTKPEAKASLLYKSCLDMNQRNKHTKKTILKFINKNLVNDNYEENLLNLLKSGLASRMISINVLQDSFNPEYNILDLNKPSLILSEGTLQSDDTDIGKEQIISYVKYMNKVLDILGIWENRTIINEIVKLHIRIAKEFPSIADQSDPEKYSNKMKISDIQTKCSEISWIKLINGVLKKSGKKLKESDEINVFSLKYVDALCEILKEYKNNKMKKTVLKMDLVWSFISDVVPMGSEELVAANEEFQSRILGITGKEEPWKACVAMTSTILTEIISSMYVKAKFDPSQKRNIELVIENIKKALKSVIEQVTWMDSVTKEAALIKLSVMTNKIGYPDELLSDFYLSNKYQSVKMCEDTFLKNYIGFQKFALNDMMKTVGEKIRKELWIMGSWEVNAYYNPSSNEIVFPAAQLRFPMYDIGLPSFYNYGAIGSIIGHEILHGFDTDGSKFDSKGLLRQWWSTSSREEYLKKTQCIVDQYGQYKIHNVSLPSQQTVGEDIADNAGTRMSFIAANIHNNGKENLTLPGLDFTYEQLFFIGQAKSWCTLFKKEALLEKMKGDVHTIWKYRIIGPQSNMPEFSKAFNCSSNKKMNRPKKCLVW